MNVNLLNIKGKKVSDFELAESIFGQVSNENTIYEASKAYLANQRQGTVSTKIGRAHV